MASAPPERPYTPQVTPGGSAPFGGASPDAFGASIGEGMSHLGGVVEQGDLTAYRLELERRKASEASDVGVQLANVRAQMPAAIEQMRDSAAPDGSGHVEQVGKWFDDAASQILGSVQNREVAQHFQGVVADMRASTIGEETAWAHGVRAFHQVQNAADTWRQLADAQAEHPSDDVGDSLNLYAKTVQGLHLDPVATDNAMLEGQRQIVLGHLQGRIQTGNPQAALNLIDSGVFNKYDLNPEEINSLRRQAEVQIRRQDVLQRQQVAQQARDANTFIENIGKRVENHEPVPPADFAQAQHFLDDPNIGPKLQGHTFDLHKWQATDGFTRQYQGAAPQIMSARLDALSAEIARQGDKVNPDHVLERNYLQDALPKAREAVRADPLGLYAQSGGQVTPIDWSDPATMGARLGQAKLAQGRNGGMLTVLTQDEASQLEQELAKGNTAGRIDIVSRLAAGGPEFAQAAARQIAPGNQHLQTAAALAAMGPYGMANARDSLYGADAIDAHKGIINEKAFGTVFSQAAQALTGVPPDMQHGVYDTAMGLTATRLTRAGQTQAWPGGLLGATQDGYQRKIAQVAVNEALGGSKRPDGSYAGGIGTHAGVPTLLPTTMTQQEFDAAIARSTPTDFARAAGGVTPVDSTGRAPSIPQFKAMRLEAVRNGIYRVKLGNAYLARGDGRGIYEFDANKLPH